VYRAVCSCVGPRTGGPNLCRHGGNFRFSRRGPVRGALLRPLARRKLPTDFRLRTRGSSCSGSSWIGTLAAPCPTAALFARMSSRPNSATGLRTIDSNCPASPTSTTRGRARHPGSPISRARVVTSFTPSPVHPVGMWSDSGRYLRPPHATFAHQRERGRPANSTLSTGSCDSSHYAFEFPHQFSTRGRPVPVFDSVLER